MIVTNINEQKYDLMYMIQQPFKTLYLSYKLSKNLQPRKADS